VLRYFWFGREVRKREVGERVCWKRGTSEKKNKFDVLFGIREIRKK